MPTSFRDRRIALLLAMALLAVVTGLAATLRCATCGAVIKGRYIQSSGKIYCSQTCYEKTLPKCATCGKAITGPYLQHMGRNYCSQKCVGASLPKCELCGKPLRRMIEIKGHLYCEEHGNGTRCDACGLPLIRGKELPDRRVLCPHCAERVVLELDDARKIYERAQREVEALTGIDLGELPPLELVGRDRMPSFQQGMAIEDIQERGFYRQEVKTDTYTDDKGRVVRTDRQVKETICILYGLTPDELLCTSGHELTHALQARFLPAIQEKAPLWLKEGICQYVAAIIARRHHFADELTSIEKSPHPAYGRGYRYLKQRFGPTNWAGLLAWLKNLDPTTLPAELPDDQTP